MPQFSCMKYGEFDISCRKICTPIFLDDVWRISYFRQENLHPKFPGWNMENFIFQAENSTLQVSGLKYRKFHISGSKLCTTGLGLKYGKFSTSGRKLCAPSFWLKYGEIHSVPFHEKRGQGRVFCECWLPYLSLPWLVNLSCQRTSQEEVASSLFLSENRKLDQSCCYNE